MRTKVLHAFGILVASAALALGANALRSDGVPLIRTKPPSAATESHGVAVISLGSFLEATTRPGVVILDARPAEDFEEAHIPRAQNLPSEASEEQFAAVLQDLGYDQEIITYCSGIECDAAEEVAAQLLDRGYMNVKVFSGGWEEWMNSDLSIESELE